MRQPLMVTLNRIPPAQAEALYDATLDKRWNAAENRLEALEAQWPGEDWDDESEAVSEIGTARSPRLVSPRLLTARA
ncbi:MAG: hypothetical protein M3Y28_01200 [Armatimonadota bacterium]|nr:hypothetical protein [Armatimonadota bacterium]